MSGPTDETKQVDVDFPLWRLLDHTRYMIFRLREIELARFNLTPEQAFVLDIIHASGGSTTINRIVEMSQHRHNSISALVDRMARQGLLRKNRTRRDRRAFRILSTPKGEGLLGKVPRDSILRSLDCLKSSEKKQLASLLTRLLLNAYNVAGVGYPSAWPQSADHYPDD
jgi:DNA-binding MarR family transcriptional regulator